MFGDFFKPTAKVLKRIDKLSEITKSLKQLADEDILVGIPEDEAARKEPGMTNAQLAYIQSKGSPVNNIPPRPFLEPSIDAHVDEIAKQQGVIIKDVLEGKSAEAAIEMEKLGLYAQTQAKMWFVDPDNQWPPNAPSTIRRKKSAQPLIDSAQMRNAVSYVIRKKK